MLSEDWFDFCELFESITWREKKNFDLNSSRSIFRAAGAAAIVAYNEKDGEELIWWTLRDANLLW